MPSEGIQILLGTLSGEITLRITEGERVTSAVLSADDVEVLIERLKRAVEAAQAIKVT